ncbi:F-box/LRR-repeat protein 4-like [Pistacia vera]|uniref:F-box/LRR-repeat protein 4-like n=1 Tax=Pistacia vera TaxID=55513 RepID=UPI0012633F64|nr:F-box/LRR-repeat protein 4-like [Pistacia vera]
MSTLGDDELSLIHDRLNDQDRNSFSLVCKQWLRVEGENRSSIRVLEPDSLHRFLPRFPNLVTFESSKLLTDAHLEFIAKTCPKIQNFSLNFKETNESYDHDYSSSGDNFGDDGVCALANGCRNLCKVLLRKRRNIGNVAVLSIINNSSKSLTNLDLGRCSLIGDQALEAIGMAKSIRVLNLDGCTLITDNGLSFLANGSCSKSLKKLVMAECDRVTDRGVSLLQQMCWLEELNLAECGPKVTDLGGLAVASIRTLKKLNFSWLINVSDTTLVAIAENCNNLLAIDLTGCELITGVGVRALGNHECLESLGLASIYNIKVDDLDTVLARQSLRHIVLDKGLRIWIPPAMQDNISRFCHIHWK